MHEVWSFLLFLWYFSWIMFQKYHKKHCKCKFLKRTINGGRNVTSIITEKCDVLSAERPSTLIYKYSNKFINLIKLIYLKLQKLIELAIVTSLPYNFECVSWNPLIEQQLPYLTKQPLQAFAKQTVFDVSLYPVNSDQMLNPQFHKVNIDLTSLNISYKSERNRVVDNQTWVT